MCVVRGTPFTQDVKLKSGYEEVVDNPTGYSGRLAFRLAQDDTLTDYFAVTAVPEVVEDCVGNESALLSFVVAPSLTQTLPPYDIVAYIDLRTSAGVVVQRLFNGKVRISD